jgi:type II secretory pathway predicted ATPase ExeA
VITHENSAFSFNDLLGLTLRALLDEGTPLARTKAARWMQFEHTLARLAAENRHLVLIFDEAQEMSACTLNELKLLTNLNGDGRGFLTLILVGQPELRERIALCPAVNQRVSLSFHLDALSLEDSANYFRHRLLAAGHATGDLFDPNAVERAFEATQGVPRALNRLGKLALEFAWLHEYPRVTYAAVDAVARDLDRHQTLLIA